MITQELLSYIKSEQRQNVTNEQIKKNLLAGNWQEQDINQAFEQLKQPSQPQPRDSDLPSTQQLISQAISLFRQKFLTIIGITIIPQLISAISYTSVLFIFNNNGITLSAQAGTSYSFNKLAFILLLLLLLLFIQAWMQIALLVTISDKQNSLGIIEAYKRGFKMILKYWWTMMVGLFIILGGLFLFVIPGIIFSIWFSLAAFVLVTENTYGMNALLKSREYIKNMWGNFMGRIFVIGTGILIINQLIVSILTLLNVPYKSEITTIINGVIVLPFGFICSFLLFDSLKTIKGEVTFPIPTKKKALYLFIGVLGFIVPLVILFSVFMTFKKSTMNIRDTQRKFMTSDLQFALMRFYSTHEKKYPTSIEELVQSGELKSVLVDPLTNKPYQYSTTENGNDYQICVYFEQLRATKCITSKDDGFRLSY